MPDKIRRYKYDPTYQIYWFLFAPFLMSTPESRDTKRVLRAVCKAHVDAIVTSMHGANDAYIWVEVMEGDEWKAVMLYKMFTLYRRGEFEPDFYRIEDGD